jgi:hypothetical protein
MSYEHSQRILKIIIDSINQYNNYRAPEAYAELIEFKGNYFTVRFTWEEFSPHVVSMITSKTLNIF